MSAEGLKEIQDARAAGFSDQEIQDYIISKKAEAESAGFSSADVDAYYGSPPFDDAPIKALLQENHAAATQPTGDGKTPPKPITNFSEALEAGLQMSVSGLVARGQASDFAITEDTPRSSRIAANIMSLAGDVPAMGAGFLLGGGPVTGMAGAFALPTAIRKILMDKYEKGEVRDFSDFWDRLSGVAVDTAKSWITGAATGAVGKAVGAAAIPSKVLKGAAVTSSELATMVTVGNALEGKVPSADEFIDGALTLGFIKGAAAGAKKLRNIYSETGVRPEQLASDAEKDPTILQDLHSDNIDVPRKYKDPSTVPAVQPGGGAVGETTAQTAKPSGGAGSALDQIRDYIVDGAREKEPLTWKKVYTQLWDQLHPINVKTRLAESLGEKPEQVQGEIVLPGELRTGPLLRIPHVETDLVVRGEHGEILEVKPGKREEATGRPLSGIEAPYEAVGDSVDPYTLARLLPGNAGRAAHSLEIGTYSPVTRQVTGEALQPILKSQKDIESFENYLVAARAVEWHSRGLDPGIPLDLAKQAQKEGQAKFGKDAKRITEYSNRVTSMLRESGYLSKEQEQAMLDANKHYVPFFRAFTSDPATAAKSSMGSPLHKAKGSQSPIVNPLESLVKNTYVYTSLAERNLAMRSYIDMADKTGRPDLFYKKRPPDTMDIELTEPELKKLFKELVEVSTTKTTSTRSTTKETKRTGETKTTTQAGEATAPGEESKAFKLVKARVLEALKARGFSEGESSQMVARLMEADKAPSGKSEHTVKTETVERVIKEVEKTVYEPTLNMRVSKDVATITRAISRPLREDEIAVFKDGKRTVYAVDKDVAQAFKAVDVESANLLVKLLAIPSKALRAGVILTPEFTARNLMTDYLSAFVNAKGALFSPVDTLSGFMSYVRKDDHFARWLRSGAANAAMVSMDRNYLKQHLLKLHAETGLMEKTWNVVKSPIDVLRTLSELVENSTRLGRFKQVTTPESTGAEVARGGLVSRESTIDFSRIGASMRAVNMISAFANVGLQGPDRMVRAFKEQPVGTPLKILAGITMPSLMLWWVNKDDPRWPGISTWEKFVFWHVMTPDHIYRIRKPFEMGVIFGSGPERLLEKYFEDNPDAFKGFDKAMVEAFTPNLIPQFPAPMIEQLGNISLFTNAPLIPSSAEKLLPEYQYKPHTTELAKAIGAMIGAFPGMREKSLEQDTVGSGVARALTSPILMENYVRGWTGGLGTYILQLADKALRVAGKVPDPVGPEMKLEDLPVIRAFMTRYPSAQAQQITDFYRNFSVSERYIATFNFLAQKGDPKAKDLFEQYADKMVSLSDMRDALTKQGHAIMLIQKNPDFTPQEQGQLIDTLYFGMIQIADNGNKAMRQIQEAAQAAQEKP